MKEIIQRADINLLLKELNDKTFVRTTNNGNNEIYIVSNLDSPNVMLEIGRLREITFRQASGGTGKDADIDEFDTDVTPYKQLIVWNPRDKEIIGGYRFILCKDARKIDGIPNLSTGEIFDFTQRFIDEYIPCTIELGRSFIQPNYQSTNDLRRNIFSLDNLWDGLGAIVYDNPEMKYFFGKVTMYTSYNVHARDLLLYFLRKYFPDKDKLVYPKNPVLIKTNIKTLEKIFDGKTFDDDYRILMKNVKGLNENIPPLISSYINLSPTMRSFGTAINEHFGGVEETAILINIDDIYPHKKERHINTYKKD